MEPPREPGAPAANAAVRDVVSVALDFAVAGRSMHAEISIDAAPVSAAALVPIARAMLEAVGERVLELVATEGRAVSCRMGCGACCRQLVPLPIVEARAIRALVEQLPEPRRSAIRRRFAAVRDALQAAGLLDEIANAAALPREAAHALAMRYFKLGLACPFLENESCSIHPDRPLVCREYLVTSPAAFCADPAAGRIDGVPRPARFNEAMIIADPETTPGTAFVPLSLAPGWVEQHPAPVPQTPGPELLRRFLTALLGRDIPDPSAAGDSATMLPRTR